MRAVLRRADANARTIAQFVDAIERVDHDEAVAKKATSDEKKKSQVFKTDEQMKMNKVANKRRLFNRKTGE